jgi:hypothetical protein
MGAINPDFGSGHPRDRSRWKDRPSQG